MTVAARNMVLIAHKVKIEIFCHIIPAAPRWVSILLFIPEECFNSFFGNFQDYFPNGTSLHL